MSKRIFSFFSLLPILLLVFIVAANATEAVKAPRIYGKVHREIRYVDQDRTGYRKIVPTGTNVYNIPNRIGALGSAYTAEGLEIKYNLELGLMDREGLYGYYGSSGVVLRLANAGLTTDYGTLTLGKAYPATALVGTLLDPLADTGVSLYGLDQQLEVASMDLGIGYTFRSFRPLIMYKTDQIAGFQLAISVDSNDNGKQSQAADPARTALITAGIVSPDTPGYPPTYYEALVTYRPMLEQIKAKVSLGYVKPSGAGALGEKNRTIGALEIDYKDFKVGFLHQQIAYEHGSTYTPQKVKTKRMMAIAQYVHKMKHQISLTYGQACFEKLALSGTTIQTKRKTSQIAVGYKYKLNHFVGLTASYGRLERKEDDNANAASNNKASRVMTGIALNF